MTRNRQNCTRNAVPIKDTKGIPKTINWWLFMHQGQGMRSGCSKWKAWLGDQGRHADKAYHK